MIKININHRYRHLVKMAAVSCFTLILSGCISFERIVNNPADQELITVEDYKFDLYKQSLHIFDPIPLDHKVSEFKLQPKVDHLFFLIDQTTDIEHQISQNQVFYKENQSKAPKRFLGIEIARRFAQTMPNLKFNGAVLQLKETKSYHSDQLPITEFTANELNELLKTPSKIADIQSRSLSDAIDELSFYINKLPGSSAVIIITDWSKIDSNVEKSVLRMRQRSSYHSGLSISFNEKDTNSWSSTHSGICLYTIGVGNQLSRSRLEAVDTCGFSVAANKIAQPRDMAHFVQNVLFKGPADTDGDGIYDYLDKCPNTAKGRIVNFSGCLRFNKHIQGVIQ